MKYQQVSVDLVNMMMTACSYLALAGAAWILLRLLQACFWLPRHFRKQNDVQKLLQDKVDSYEQYLAECEARDKVAGVDCDLEGIDDNSTSLPDGYQKSDKWRKQRESLEMLKQELSRVRDGINVTDWDYLLEENQTAEGAGNNGNEIKSEKNKTEENPTQVIEKKATKEFLEKEEKEEEEEENSNDEKKDK